MTCYFGSESCRNGHSPDCPARTLTSSRLAEFYGTPVAVRAGEFVNEYTGKFIPANRCNASDGEHICTLYEGHPSSHSAMGGRVTW